MESDSGFGLFDDFPEGETHPLQIDLFDDGEQIEQLDEDEREGESAFEASLRKMISSKQNIYAPVKGDTVLHQAIKSGVKLKIDALLEMYQKDYDKVKNYLVSKYKCSVNDKICLKKTILVAVGKDQCQAAKDLEQPHIQGVELMQAIFVLLQHPVNGEEVAVIHPNQTNRLAACKLIRTLIPNGFLTWNFTAADGKSETFVEAAASRGMTYVIDRLYNLGAELSIPNHNPLIAACRSLKKDTIRWLLTKHFDHFDCTLRDSGQNNALIVLMQKKNPELFEFVLDRMISYRQKYFNESESQAFNNIFRYENEDYSSLSILTCFGNYEPMRKKIEECVIRYQLDLSYQWKNVSVLACLLGRKLASEYCFDGIRKNPKLLGLVQYGHTTILHDLIRWGHIEFLKHMYTENPEVKKYFENESGINTLRHELSEHHEDKLQFIRDYHMEYLMSDVQKMKEEVFCCSYYSLDFYQIHGAIMIQYFPEFKTAIEEAWKQAPEWRTTDDLEPSFAKLGIHVTKSSADIPTGQHPLNNLRGSNGETLLHLAVDKDNEELVNQLLNADSGVDTLDNNGNHHVHYVKSVEMLSLLIDRHPEGRELVHRINSDGYSVLHRVCSLYMQQSSRIALLEKVIDCGADVNHLNKNGESVIFMIGNCTLLDVLRKHDVKLDVVNCNGETALQRHLCNKNACMGKALLYLLHEYPTFKDHAHKYLAPMMNSNRDFFSCDYQRFLEKYPETTKLLFDAVYEHSREEASRLFAKACSSAMNFIVEKFLDFDYDLDYNYKDEDRYTPIIGLLSYMEENNGHLIKRLLEKGVDLETCNNWGRNALLTIVGRFPFVRWYGHDAGTIQLLLDHGAQVNSSDADGNTSLHLAVGSSEWELVEVLVQNGGDLRAMNKNGRIPLEMGSRVNQELFYFMN